MLLTDPSWEERHPGKRALAKPYKAWQCICWTDEIVKFLVVTARGRRDHASMPDGWLIDGPEPLLVAATQWEPGSYVVYVLDRAANDDRIELCQVAGIWREREGGLTPRLWYSTSLGDVRPCSLRRLVDETRPELVNELTFGTGHATP